MSVPDLHFQGTDAMARLIGLETELSNDERDRHQSEWSSLKSEDAPLRVVQDGALVSAPIDYFDDIILSFVSTEWQPAMRVVGDAFSTICIEKGHFISDLFTQARVTALATSQAIEWDGNIGDVRGSKVRLAQAVSSG